MERTAAGDIDQRFLLELVLGLMVAVFPKLIDISETYLDNLMI